MSLRRGFVSLLSTLRQRPASLSATREPRPESYDLASMTRRTADLRAEVQRMDRQVGSW
jgi:hypothetical protein